MSRAYPAAGIAAAAAIGLSVWLGGVVVAQRARVTVGAQPDGSHVVPTNQVVTPIGQVRRTPGGRPKDLAVSPDRKLVAVLTTAGVSLFSVDGSPAGDAKLRTGALGIAWGPDSTALFVSGGDGRVHRLERSGEALKGVREIVVAPSGAAPVPGAREKANPQPNGLAVSPDGRRLYAALGIRNELAVVSLPEGTVTKTLPVGVAPYSVALSPDGRTLAVGCRGGLRAPSGGPTASSAGSAVRIDPETDAARSGSIVLIDTETLEAMEMEAGRQPCGMAFSPDGRTLYVANSDGDTVSIIDVKERRIRRSVPVGPPDDPGFGQIPTSVALSADGRRLYVACGGSNSVAVVEPGRRERVAGYLPAAWFPIALATAGDRLIVAASKGIGARPASAGGKYGVHQSVGTVQFIAPEDSRELAAHTGRVRANNRWGKEGSAPRRVAAVPVPERVGEPSVFKHVVYILKENHSYDLDLGDMPEGNGDKSLCLFGEEVTPNAHAIARQWVLLDNTYTSGTNSADGHQWTGSAVANGYIEQNYGAHSRSYPYDGGDPLGYSPEGFVWTAARKKGLSVRIYGEFVNRPRIELPGVTGRSPTWTQLWRDYKSGENRARVTAETDNAALRPLLHPSFIGFPTNISDQWRADRFLEDLDTFERSGRMPSLCMLLLPNNHTNGTSPGYPTPRAMVADNDLALGRIVDRLSRSRFWKETLILVIEDDSQLAFDHVDGHRTVAFCISPYTRRKAVISEPYNHTSFLRTIGLVLGVPPMTRFDRTADPLTACFTAVPDFSPYTHLPNRVALDEMNPPSRALRGEDRVLAEACAGMDWSDLDRVDPEIVGRAVWRSRRPAVPLPRDRFNPPAE